MAATVTLVLALAGLLAATIGLGIQLLPRHFTSAQQQEIMAWEIAGRWRDLPAGQIFPGRVTYAPPAAINDNGGPVTLGAGRLGIARQASCGGPGGSQGSAGSGGSRGSGGSGGSRGSGGSAADTAAAAVLARNGCEAVLRATYADGTGTYVMTVGVVPFPSVARADAARRELDVKRLRMSGGRSPGVRALPVAGTAAARFANSRRQLTANIVAGPYLVMYAVGYADGRPLVPVAADSYADAEMNSFGVGVAESVAAVLGTPPSPPRCPGAPGC